LRGPSSPAAANKSSGAEAVLEDELSGKLGDVLSPERSHPESESAAESSSSLPC